MRVPSYQAQPLAAESLARKRIFVLGASGPTGQLILSEVANRGYDIAALVRHPIANSYPERTNLFRGDALDEMAVNRAMDGCHAVISSLGAPISPIRSVTTLSKSTQVLVDTMRRQRIRRLVCITGVGAGDSRGHGGFLYDKLMLPLLLRQVYKDKDRQEAIVQASDLDWIVVRPVILQDKPGTGRIFAQTDLSRIHGGRIARADVAKFVVDQLTDDTWLHRSPLIMSNRRTLTEDRQD